jgi:hypothetical protein
VQTVLELHFLLATLILTAGGLALIAGIVALVLRRGLGANDAPTMGNAARFTAVFRALMWVTAGLGVLQALVGGVLFLIFQLRPDEALHYVYGGIVLLAIPIAYVYSDQKRVRRDLIIMVIAVVALVGAAVRALMTGGAIPH